MSTELTYVALRRLKVGGKYRQPGDLVPEAEDWRNVNAYIARGHLAAIPKETTAVDAEVVEKDKQKKTGYDSLTAEQVREQVDDGTMTVEEAYENETAREKPRTTLLSWLEDRAAREMSDEDE